MGHQLDGGVVGGTEVMKSLPACARESHGGLTRMKPAPRTPEGPRLVSCHWSLVWMSSHFLEGHGVFQGTLIPLVSMCAPTKGSMGEVPTGTVPSTAVVLEPCRSCNLLARCFLRFGSWVLPHRPRNVTLKDHSRAELPGPAAPSVPWDLKTCTQDKYSDH